MDRRTNAAKKQYLVARNSSAVTEMTSQRKSEEMTPGKTRGEARMRDHESQNNDTPAIFPCKLCVPTWQQNENE